MSRTKKRRKSVWDDDYYEKTTPGTPDDWAQAFRQRMGFDEAEEVLGEDSPWTILGVFKDAPKGLVKKAYRALILKWHPDKWMTKSQAEQDKAAQMTLKVIAAYTVLKGQ
jgi:DnaJ-class molecular chaperone